ncbi:hypothetical protein [Cyanobium sp. N5-Cardenillas]|uniref:hypothetical protein n=1 Tax=Cyanobium sp. N5-Cardenillas TaxID=2823720 RepID=UPI003965875C
MLRELGDDLDRRRVHFVGRVPHPVLHELFRVTACHGHLTVPFVLSWSLLEAMSCGALVIGSATAPVQDLIVDGHDGLRREARRTVVERFDLARVCLPQQLELVDRLLA